MPETEGALERDCNGEHDAMPLDGLSAADGAVAHLASIVEKTSDLVGITDGDGRVLYMNRAGRDRFGWERRKSALLTTVDLFAPPTFDVYYRDIRPRLVAGESWSGEIQMLDADRNVIDVWVSVTAGIGPAGEVEYLAMIGRDVTSRRARELELTRRATHDILTGLPNRAHFSEHVELALARAQRSGTGVGVLFVDVDDFKWVNDRFSHSGGDIVLREVARRITHAVRPSDVVARFGGDEFVIACESATHEELRVIGTRVFESLARSPYEVGSAHTVLTASVGVAFADDPTRPEVLVREADAAMYSAKRHGKGRVELFDETLRGQVRGREEMVHDLAVAVGSGALGVLFQPVVDLRSGAPAAVEAMLTWDHPERGAVPAAELRYLAEDAGVGVAMGMQLLRRAARTARVWERALGRRVPRLQVEVAPELVAEDRFPEMVDEMLHDTGIDPAGLCLEISEAAFSSRTGDVLRSIAGLRALGVAITIDDFGSGGSSLDLLRQADIDGLKIASPFVDGLRSDRGDRAVVTAAISVARALNAWSVASGVETIEQLAGLRELECDAGQGAFFAVPVTGGRGTDLLTRRYPG